MQMDAVRISISHEVNCDTVTVSVTTTGAPTDPPWLLIISYEMVVFERVPPHTIRRKVWMPTLTELKSGDLTADEIELDVPHNADGQNIKVSAFELEADTYIEVDNDTVFFAHP